MEYMFKLEIIVDEKKDFKTEGISITTDGVSASVHFIIPKNCDKDKPEEMSKTC